MVEIDCISYAVAAAAKAGTPAIGGVIYTTRYPFSNICVSSTHDGVSKRLFYLPMTGNRITKKSSDVTARLARELNIAIEPMFEDEDPRFTKNSNDRHIDESLFPEANPFAPDEYDPNNAAHTYDEDTTTI